MAWSEVSIAWIENGVLCKGRIDRLASDNSLIIDLKKCQVGKGTDEHCRAAIANYGWDVQQAMYRRGIEVLTGKRPDFLWLFVEDGPPYEPNVLEADDVDYEIGLFKFQAAIQKWKHFQETGIAHGYLYQTHDGKCFAHKQGLPVWERRKWEDVINGRGDETSEREPEPVDDDDRPW